MRIFVFEYVTGGGCAGQPLPPFVGDGEAMWRALVGDLTALDGVEVITLRDARLAVPSRAGLDVIATGAADFAGHYRHCLEAADAVWPVAPESGGLLEGLSRDILAAGKRLLGSGPDAVAVAASKLATGRRLAAAGPWAVPTYDSPFHMHEDRPVVAKPDDGAGCQDTFRFAGLEAARAWAQAGGAGGQPFAFQYELAGEPLSLSLLCDGGRAQLLSVNRQHVTLEDGRFQAHGVTVNALADPDGVHAALAGRVARALPELWGYVGVDFMATPEGPRVLEINPRLTLSYAGLGEATGGNVAARVLALPAFSPCRGLRPVEVSGPWAGPLDADHGMKAAA